MCRQPRQRDRRRELQVNLFLHQVTHNAAWRNAGLPSLGGDGKHPAEKSAAGARSALSAHGLWFRLLAGRVPARLRAAVLHEYPVLARADIAPRWRIHTMPRTHAAAPAPARALSLVELRSRRPDRDAQNHALDARTRGDGLAVDRAEGGLPADLPFLVTVCCCRPSAPAASACRCCTAIISDASPAGADPHAAAREATAGGRLARNRHGHRRSLGRVTQVVLHSARLGVRCDPAAVHQAATIVPISPFTLTRDRASLPAGVYSLSASSHIDGQPCSNQCHAARAGAEPASAWPPSPTNVTGHVQIDVACTADLERQTGRLSLLVGGLGGLFQRRRSARRRPSARTRHIRCFPTLLRPAPNAPLRLRVDGVASPVIGRPRPPSSRPVRSPAPDGGDDGTGPVAAFPGRKRNQAYLVAEFARSAARDKLDADGARSGDAAAQRRWRRPPAIDLAGRAVSAERF